jgi:hypothetical protein
MNDAAGAEKGGLVTLAGRGLPYSFQRVYVRFMLWLIGRLLQAASAVDPVVSREVRSLPEGFSFSMRVRSGLAALAIVKQGDRLRAVPAVAAPPPTLTFEFKHMAHAFLVLSFQESTPRALANDRLSVDGEYPSAMKILRALNRMQAVVLPRFIAVRALKSCPALPLSDKLGLAARIYGRLVIQSFARTPS